MRWSPIQRLFPLHSLPLLVPFSALFTTALSQWIRSVRTPPTPDVATPTEGQKAQTHTPASVQPTQPPKTPNRAPVDTGAGRTKPTVPTATGSKSPVDVRIVDMPPLTGPHTQRAQSPSLGQKTESTKSTASSSRPTGARRRSPQPKTVSDRPSSRKIPLGLVGGGLVSLGLAGVAAYVLKDRAAVGKLRRRHGQQEDSAEHIGSRLVAFVGDRREELGDLDDIQEITIGKGLGSHIFIDEPGVEDRHARVFRRRKGLRVQNTAGVPIALNGKEMPPKGKMAVVLPADLELAPGVTVNLMTEPVELEMEVDDHEDEVA